MVRIPFWKLSGGGNDFVLLAGLPKGRSGAILARRLCERRRGIGADGLLVMSRRAGHIRLDYWNADGSAAFCGNGSRCAALWAASRGWTKRRRFVLETNRGPLTARLTTKGRASVSMPTPKELRLDRKITVLKRSFKVHFVDTGVPHAVVLVPDIKKMDVARLGRALRFHRAFGKSGANVDFVEVKNNSLLLRTYERGVENETLACGTGIVAAAFVTRALGFNCSPAHVKVRSGATLTVQFASSDVSLEGPGEIVFTGEAAV